MALGFPTSGPCAGLSCGCTDWSGRPLPDEAQQQLGRGCEHAPGKGSTRPRAAVLPWKDRVCDRVMQSRYKPPSRALHSRTSEPGGVLGQKAWRHRQFSAGHWRAWWRRQPSG